MDEPLAWLEAVGIDPGGLRPQWKVHVELETHGDIPGPVWSEDEPRFSLNLRPWGWTVGLLVGHAWFHFGKQTGKPGARHAVDTSEGITPLAVVSPRALASIPRWLARCEERLDIRFRRDRPRIRSDINGGAKAMARWITHK
jgi:hypothetical protein